MNVKFLQGEEKERGGARFESLGVDLKHTDKQRRVQVAYS